MAEARPFTLISSALFKALGSGERAAALAPVMTADIVEALHAAGWGFVHVSLGRELVSYEVAPAETAAGEEAGS